MRKFGFKLQKLLDYRRTVEEKMLAELAVIRAEERAASDLLVSFKAECDGFRGDMKEKLSGSSVDDIKDSFEYLKELNRRVVGQQQKLASLAESRHRKTLELLEAAKDRKILERLREQKKAEYKVEVEHGEQKFLDDIATIRHCRTCGGSEVASGG